MLKMNGITNNVVVGGVEKPKEWQLELLMEKLRSKANQFKTFTEISKSVRMSLLEKRYPLDNVEKNQHQKCLDTLQHSIKVTSLQSMVERLESLTRQLGLKFMVGPSGVELFISSEMFYLEIVLDVSGSVRDVKVHHEGKVEQQSCIELVNCLSRGDFLDFTTQLEGLSSIYQINAEKKIKCKAFSALQALETDLSTLAQLQTFIKEPFNLLHKSPVGILEKRKGGHAMKLTYFVSPYDLLDKDKGTSDPLTVETVTAKSLGYSVTVCMEGSSAHKLQTTTIISVNRNLNGKNTPSYAPLSSQNSAVLPACFVLRLNKPLPMCVCLVRRIQQITDMECGDLAATHPLLSLITQHVSAGQLDCALNKGLFVTLPDQHHCYFMTESKSMDGILVNSIPFTHPCHVPQILNYLRQQALFNSVVASCIRPCSKQDLESMIMFEVSALSWQHLSISLEHPLEESMATAELDLTDISNVNCKIYTPISNGSLNQPGSDPTSELASKVFQRCLSIPITMRSVIKQWDEQINRKNHLNGNENFSLPLGTVDPGGHNGTGNHSLTDFTDLDGKMKSEPGCNSSGGGSGNGHTLSGTSLAHPHQGMFLNESIMVASGFPDMLSNIEITSLLVGDKTQKKQKRKLSDDEYWKNPKRKPGDEESEMTETSSDSTSVSIPSNDATSDLGMATPNSTLGFQSDLELSGLDAPESDKTLEYECSREDELGDVEDLIATTVSRSEHKSRKSREERKSSSSCLLMDLAENKNLVSPSVSITPINSSQNFSTVLTGMGLERRPGIEIIPIASSPATTLPSSITITPISTTHKGSSDEKRSEKKSSKNRSDDKSRLERKRKRKRDESPMGPPDKLPPKQDALSKPVTVSIKPAESPPLPSITPTSPSSMLRKFSSSPLSGKSSPSMLKPTKPGHSPKHSPGHVISSPKHTSIPGISSPKNPSTSGTGKPSMSTLKSAANSPSSKSSDSLKPKSKESGNRDKDKKLSSSSSVFSVNNPKVKLSGVKIKQLDLSVGADLQNVFQSGEGLPSPSGNVDLSKSAGLNQVRNRKGSLSAVIDKLKSAQHCGPEGEGGNNNNNNNNNNQKSGNRDGRSSTSSSKLTEAKNLNKTGETKNSEYMVKPSLDGMKITINKTKSKSSSSSSNSPKLQTSTVGTGSPKTHTGLKPGVNSGPASKKPQQLNQKSIGNTSIYNTAKTSTGKSSNSGSNKSSNSSILGTSKSTSKLSGSPKSAGDLSQRSKESRPRLKPSDKSIFSSSKSEARRSSPTLSRDEIDSERAFKLLAQHSKLDQALMMEGMIKSLDTNFQIPKLSARGDPDKKIASNKNATPYSDSSMNNIPRTLDSVAKMFDISKTDLSLPKYPLSLTNANNLDVKSLRLSSASPLLSANSFTPSTSPKLNLITSQSGLEPTNLSITELNTNAEPEPKSVQKLNNTSSDLKDDSSSVNCKLSFPTPKTFSAPDPIPDDKKAKGCTTPQEAAEMLLDFSSNSMNKSSEHLTKLPLIPSPSVSVHIVKSPAPSPHINPATPHSASPCITDDELMDEALVGLGK